VKRIQNNEDPYEIFINFKPIPKMYNEGNYKNKENVIWICLAKSDKIFKGSDRKKTARQTSSKIGRL